MPCSTHCSSSSSSAAHTSQQLPAAQHTLHTWQHLFHLKTRQAHTPTLAAPRQQLHTSKTTHPHNAPPRGWPSQQLSLSATCSQPAAAAHSCCQSLTAQLLRCLAAQLSVAHSTAAVGRSQPAAVCDDVGACSLLHVLRDIRAKGLSVPVVHRALAALAEAAEEAARLGGLLWWAVLGGEDEGQHQADDVEASTHTAAGLKVAAAAAAAAGGQPSMTCAVCVQRAAQDVCTVADLPKTLTAQLPRSSCKRQKTTLTLARR